MQRRGSFADFAIDHFHHAFGGREKFAHDAIVMLSKRLQEMSGTNFGLAAFLEKRDALLDARCPMLFLVKRTPRRISD